MKGAKSLKDIFGKAGKQISQNIAFDEIPEEINNTVREYVDKKLDKVLECYDRHARE